MVGEQRPGFELRPTLRSDRLDSLTVPAQLSAVPGPVSCVLSGRMGAGQSVIDPPQVAPGPEFGGLRVFPTWRLLDSLRTDQTADVIWSTHLAEASLAPTQCPIPA